MTCRSKRIFETKSMHNSDVPDSRAIQITLRVNNNVYISLQWMYNVLDKCYLFFNGTAPNIK